MNLCATSVKGVRSQSDLGQICCKSVCTVHIPSLFWSIEQLLPCKIDKICPRPAKFSLRFPKSDRLLPIPRLLRRKQSASGIVSCWKIPLPLFSRSRQSGRSCRASIPPVPCCQYSPSSHPLLLLDLGMPAGKNSSAKRIARLLGVYYLLAWYQVPG
jgi:hypothetical protein